MSNIRLCLCKETVLKVFLSELIHSSWFGHVKH